MNLKNKLKIITNFIFISTAILLLSGCSLFSTKVNLNKYITISSQGYNSYGEAMYKIDWDSYEEDLSGKIKSSDKNYESMYYDSIQEEALDECVTKIYFDKFSKLSNGDEIYRNRIGRT